MLSQVAGLAVDIGLGALAISLVRVLKANLASMAVLLAEVIKTQKEHDTRITRLENNGN